MPADGQPPQLLGFAPEQINTGRPHPARMYDYYLGGKDHYAVDAEAAEEVLRRTPQVRDSTRANRAWMHRAVRYLAETAGVRQFLDLGTGVPTSPNPHEVAQRVDPACRVLYMDNDPIVLAHAGALLTSGPAGRVTYRHGDLHRPAAVLDEARAADVRFDWDRPIALILSAVLHFVPDEADPAALIRAYCDALPDGSYLAMSHATGDYSPPPPPEPPSTPSATSPPPWCCAPTPTSSGCSTERVRWSRAWYGCRSGIPDSAPCHDRKTGSATTRSGYGPTPGSPGSGPNGPPEVQGAERLPSDGSPGPAPLGSGNGPLAGSIGRGLDAVAALVHPAPGAPGATRAVEVDARAATAPALLEAGVGIGEHADGAPGDMGKHRRKVSRYPQPRVAELERGHRPGGGVVDDLKTARIKGPLEHAIESEPVDRFS